MKRIYRVILAKYADMYVEADNPEEAKVIANDRLGEWYDENPETFEYDADICVDSCESEPTSVKELEERDEWPRIYTSKGHVKLWNYKEGGEE